MIDTLPNRELPPESVVDVWTIALDTVADSVPVLDRILSEEERERASRFVFDRDARRFRARRAMLRLALAWYLRMTPEEIRLTTRWSGKPGLDDSSPLRFNLSHSEGFALFGFAARAEIGVDLESHAREVEALEMAEAYFTSRETSAIAAGTTLLRRKLTFLRLWTRKEAVLKAAGCGLLQDLNTFDVSGNAGEVVSLLGSPEEIAGASWIARDLEIKEGYSASLAMPPGNWVIRQWKLSDSEAIARFLTLFNEFS